MDQWYTNIEGKLMKLNPLVGNVVKNFSFLSPERLQYTYCPGEVAVDNLCRLMKAKNAELVRQKKFCNFCKEIGHVIRQNDRVVCPLLYDMVCNWCGATGEDAHIESYCPERPINTSCYLEIQKRLQRQRAQSSMAIRTSMDHDNRQKARMAPRRR